MHTGAAQTINLFGITIETTLAETGARRSDRTIPPAKKPQAAIGGSIGSEAARDGDEYYAQCREICTPARDYYVSTRSPGAKSATDITFFIVDSKPKAFRPGAGSPA